ncbi:MAG: flagellar hook assembly protein FlgD, partial [Planctomycetota bacterium]
GDKCMLLRFEADKTETIFEPNDAKYIFAIATDDKGNIYLGTGPEGKVYRFDPFDPAATGLVYDSLDKNVLSLAIGKDGFVYAGSDNRGLVYKIDPRTKTATVLYDSEQPEITALLFTEQDELHAAATSAETAKAETKFAAQLPLAGRPEVPSEKKEDASDGESGRSLKIANTKRGNGDKAAKRKAMPKPPKPSKASYVYKITRDGYVADVFSGTVVLFALAAQQGNLLVGTGNSAQLFTIDPVSEQEAVVYEDEQASQITAVTVSGDDVYLGTSNPAKLIKLSRRFAAEGSYTSDLVDAGQPANWGKLQIEADIPQGCKVMLASRSGNVKDINDPTFSDWTEPAEITGPMQLRCPLGRFCQYKLVLQSADGQESPLVREIAVASTVPNLAPKVESVSVERVAAAGKTGTFKISFKGKDENNDKLIYKIDFRKTGKTNWIELEDEVEADSFEWDGKTVEDGRYEVRVTASDERSNTTTTALTGSRISDPIIIDNTGPVIQERSVEKGEETVTLRLHVVDEFTAIGKMDYTVNSNKKWRGALPDDLVFDTLEEDFTITIEDLKAGEHIITVRASDDVGNTTYRTFEITLPGS